MFDKQDSVGTTVTGNYVTEANSPKDVEYIVSASDTPDDIGHIFSRSGNPGDIETDVPASDTPSVINTADSTSDTPSDIGHIFSQQNNPGDIETAVPASDPPYDIGHIFSQSNNADDIETSVPASDTPCVIEIAVSSLDTPSDIGHIFSRPNNPGDIETALHSYDTPGDIGLIFSRADNAEAAVSASDTPNDIEHIFSRTINLGDIETVLSDDIETVFSRSHNPCDIESVVYAASNPCDIESVVYAVSNPCDKEIAVSASETPGNIRNINPESNNPVSVSSNPVEIDNISFLWKLRHNDEYRIRFLHTTFVVWMFITLGWNVSIVGGTFPDLRLIMKKDLETASWLFTLGSLGYLFGALLGGLIFDRINRLLMFVAVTILNAASIAAMPWCSTFPTMLAISCLSGFFSGGIDVGGNSHVASIWGQKAAPFMQSIHFGFSFGGIISPLTAEPFLAPKSCPAPETNMTEVYEITTMLATDTTECEEIYGETHIHYAYLIAGIISLSASLPFFVLYLCSKSHNTYVSTSITSTAGFKEEKSTELATLTLSKTVLFVAFLLLLISVYACTEGRFSGLLTTFLTDHLGWSTNDGLHVTSLFWGTFAAGRFLGILITRFLKTPTMILVYLISLTLSFIGLYFAAMYEVREFVWACAALAGLSMSVIFPSIFTWTAESILTVTGIISAAYLVGVSVFNMLMPLLYGYLMDNFTQMYFVDLLIAQCIVSVGIYIVIRVLIKIYIKPQTTKTTKRRTR